MSRGKLLLLYIANLANRGTQQSPYAKSPVNGIAEPFTGL